jgi:hypothetical protein
MNRGPEIAAAIAALEAAAQETPTPWLVGELERVKAIAWARLATPKSESNGKEGQLLTLDQAAARLGVPGGWLKKRPDLPFRVVLSEGTVRYSAQGLVAYIRARRGTA